MQGWNLGLVKNLLYLHELRQKKLVYEPAA